MGNVCDGKAHTEGELETNESTVKTNKSLPENCQSIIECSERDSSQVDVASSEDKHKKKTKRKASMFLNLPMS